LSLAVAGSFAVGFGFFGERVFSASNNYFHICPIYRLGYRKTDKNMKPPFSTQQSKVESPAQKSLSTVNGQSQSQRQQQQQQPHPHQQPTGSIPAT